MRKFDDWLESRLDKAAETVAQCAGAPSCMARPSRMPSSKIILEALDRLIGILFPGCHGAPCEDTDAPHHSLLREQLGEVAATLADQTARAFACYGCAKDPCDGCGDCREKARKAVGALLDGLPEIRSTLAEDITAAYEGDPAATSTVEVVMSYPGFFAIAVHRIAHVFYKAGVPIVPRVMSEYAHSRTGIDIHPGATIGPGFFIDHGTGVVIGETCRIGRHVKLYQGVTLGARSFPKNEDGTLVKGRKRHPDVEDDVVIYAGATVLGGETVIGKGSVIGASVWITSSVPAGSKVMK